MRRQVTIKCAQCKKKFNRANSEVARRGKKSWCSLGCQRKYWDIHRASYPKIGSRHIHRIVAEKKFGRKLTSKDIVHHKDEDKQNFDPKNLQLTDHSGHAKIHFSKK